MANIGNGQCDLYIECHLTLAFPMTPTVFEEFKTDTILKDFRTWLSAVITYSIMQRFFVLHLQHKVSVNWSQIQFEIPTLWVPVSTGDSPWVRSANTEIALSMTCTSYSSRNWTRACLVVYREQATNGWVSLSPAGLTAHAVKG